jgi:hypothetical protein
MHLDVWLGHCVEMALDVRISFFQTPKGKEEALPSQLGCSTPDWECALSEFL